MRLCDKSLQCVVPANGSGNLHVVLDVEVAINSVIFVVGTQGYYTDPKVLDVVQFRCHSWKEQFERYV